MFKKKFLCLGLCIGVTAACALTACNSGNAKNSSLSSSKDVYGMGAVSTVRLLGGTMQAAAVKSLSELNSRVVASAAKAKAESLQTDETQAKEQAEKFNEYFTALDSFLGDDIVSTTTVENTDEGFEYDYKMTVSGKNFDGETVVYTMYYSEVVTQAFYQPAAHDDDKDDDDDIDDDDDKDINDKDDKDDDYDVDEKDEDKQEKKYTLTGVMVIDGANYYLEGEREEEQEGNESENELKIRAYADANNKTSYVEMAQEFSVENGETETEYVYSIYSDGVLIERTAVEFEKEHNNGNEEVEYELEFLSGGAKGKYSVERKTGDSAKAILVKYDIDGKKGSFTITEKTDENGNKKYEYTFKDGSALVF